MIASTRSVAALGSTLALLGTGACGSADDRAIPTMVVAWPQEGGGGEAQGGLPAQEPTAPAVEPDGAVSTFRTGGPAELTETVDVEGLDAARTATVEDRSAVVELLDAAGIGELGGYTLSIETGPRVLLVIDWTSVDPALDDDAWPEAVRDRGALLLATIGDLDAIVFQRPGDGGGDAAIDRTRADTLVDEPVGQLGATPAGLRELVAALEDQDVGR